jgi:hypothetical protein
MRAHITRPHRTRTTVRMSSILLLVEGNPQRMLMSSHQIIKEDTPTLIVHPLRAATGLLVTTSTRQRLPSVALELEDNPRVLLRA